MAVTDSLRDRVAAVQRAHQLGRNEHLQTACSCGWQSSTPGNTSIEHNDHVAYAVIAALGLKHEHRSLGDGEGGVSINYKTGKRTSHFRPCTRQHRYVTEWENDRAL